MTPSRRVSAIDIADAIDRRIARGGDERAVLGAVVYPLMAEHGVEAVLVELGAAKENPLLASALAYAAGVADVPLTSAFTRDEIVAAALEYLLTIGIPVPEESRLRNDLYGGYRAWFALFDHHPGYAHRRFNDAEHLELVLELIELAPFDDNALYIVGQGPLAHASEAPEQFARIQELAKSDPKIARAWSLKRDR